MLSKQIQKKKTNSPPPPPSSFSFRSKCTVKKNPDFILYKSVNWLILISRKYEKFENKLFLIFSSEGNRGCKKKRRQDVVETSSCLFFVSIKFSSSTELPLRLQQFLTCVFVEQHLCIRSELKTKPCSIVAMIFPWVEKVHTSFNSKQCWDVQKEMTTRRLSLKCKLSLQCGSLNRFGKSKSYTDEVIHLANHVLLSLVQE